LQSTKLQAPSTKHQTNSEFKIQMFQSRSVGRIDVTGSFEHFDFEFVCDLVLDAWSLGLMPA
jgi:hypothetical protein